MEKTSPNLKACQYMENPRTVHLTFQPVKGHRFQEKLHAPATDPGSSLQSALFTERPGAVVFAKHAFEAFIRHIR